MRILIPEPLWQSMRASVQTDPRETAWIGLAHGVEGSEPRLLLKELRAPSEESYVSRSRLDAQLDPVFVAGVVREARDRQMSTVFIHTHPFSEHAEFSSIDDAGEVALLDFVNRRVAARQHAAIVLGRETPAARELGTHDEATLGIVGAHLDSFPSRGAGSSEPTATSPFDRQIRAFGVAVQQKLATLRVGVVGLGGTGSLVVEQLAHLGVTDFMLVDPDELAVSNLNRVVGAGSDDVGLPKVETASRLVRRVRRDASVEVLQASVLRNDVLARLRDLDVLFCCTDSHGSRYVLNELAYRFLVPCFDCGVVIVTSATGVSHVSARVQMLAPGLACLTCSKTLHPEEVRRDLMSDFERANDPYVDGTAVEQPAVISLNGTAVSLAMTMFLGALGAFPIDTRHQRYDAIRGTVRSIDTTPNPGCVTCSTEGGLAVGDSWPLPARSQ